MALVLLGLMLVAGGLKACESSKAFVESYARARDEKAPVADRQKAFAITLRECPKEVRLYDEFASFLIEHRNFEQALVWLDKGLRVSPGNTSLRVRKAAGLLPLGRAREAVGLLGNIHSGESEFYMGIAYRHLQNHLRSREAFLRAWELGYQNDYVLYSTVQEDYALGDKQAGLERFELLLKRYPESPWVHLLLADAYFTKEQNDKARAEYLQALRTKPDILGANFRLGYLAFQDGDRESAVQYFSNEIAVNPSYVDAHLFLAEALLQLDRKREALDELRTALTLDQDSELAYKRLATTLVETNHLQEATETLRRAEQRFPKDPAFPAQRARVLTLLNQTADAHKEAERARRLTAEQHRSEELAPVR